jgi:LuxR family maltose regulon positive regulatory protein
MKAITICVTPNYLAPVGNARTRLGALPMLAEAAAVCRPILVALLNRRNVASPLLIVLDDYHYLHAAPVHEAVAFLVERLPPPVHLVIATRADPPLPVPRLRGRGQVTELRLGDLRFDQAEAAALLEATSGLDLSPAHIQALEQRTEGWAAGLQMASLALRAQTVHDGQADVPGFIKDFTGSTRYILDYLMEEVLENQPEPVQAFLQRTAILERLCGGLCEALCADLTLAQPGQPAGSQALLEQLERANLFILPLDDHRAGSATTGCLPTCSHNACYKPGPTWFPNCTSAPAVVRR